MSLTVSVLGEIVPKEKFPEFFQPVKQVIYLSSSPGNELLKGSGHV